MRLIANVKIEGSNAVRLMICHQGPNEVYVFGYTLLDDGPSAWDCHYTELEDAYEMGEDYGIQKADWKQIGDTLEFCQDDWINPVRVKGRDVGVLQWGSYEKLDNGKWVEI